MIKLKDIILSGTQPSTGCTEPVAVAWACAIASSYIEGRIKEVIVKVDKNVYKNGISVGIPYTHNKYGLEWASALGVGGNPKYFLRVLETVSKENKRLAERLIKEKKIKIKLDEKSEELKIEAHVKKEKGEAIALIKKFHTNLVKIIVNGEEKPLPEYFKKKSQIKGKMPNIKDFKLEELLKLAENIDKEVIDWIWQGIEMNVAIAQEGLKKEYGLAVGKKLKSLIEKGVLGDDVVNYASYLTAAAVDARMGGATFPVMTNAGSGNQGLGTVLPVIAFAGYYKITDRKLIGKAVTIAHLISLYVKQHTGVLSYLCGCAHGATPGAAGGILTLKGYKSDVVTKAVQNITADLTGIICDGGKPGCALKLSLSAAESVRIALLSIEGLEAQPQDGIVGVTPEESINHIGRISQKAKCADETIIQILDEYYKNK